MFKRLAVIGELYDGELSKAYNQAEERDHGRLGPSQREVREALRHHELDTRHRLLELVSRPQDRRSTTGAGSCRR